MQVRIAVTGGCITNSGCFVACTGFGVRGVIFATGIVMLSAIVVVVGFACVVVRMEATVAARDKTLFGLAFVSRCIGDLAFVIVRSAMLGRICFAAGFMKVLIRLAFRQRRFTLTVVTFLAGRADRTGPAIDTAGAGGGTIDTDVRARINAKTTVTLGWNAHLIVTRSREPSRHVRTGCAMYTAILDRIILAFAVIHMLCLAAFERDDGDTGAIRQIVVFLTTGHCTYAIGACAGKPAIDVCTVNAMRAAVLGRIFLTFALIQMRSLTTFRSRGRDVDTLDGALAVADNITRLAFGDKACAVLAQTVFPAFGHRTVIFMAATVIERIILTARLEWMRIPGTFYGCRLSNFGTFAALQFIAIGTFGHNAFTLAAPPRTPSLDFRTVIVMFTAMIKRVLLAFFPVYMLVIGTFEIRRR